MRIPQRIRRRVLTAGTILVLGLAPLLGVEARADRAAGQAVPARTLEKTGKHALAALYYHRALRALQEVWLKYWKFQDLAKFGYKPQLINQMVGEYRKGYSRCLQRAGMTQAQRVQMDRVNELWMEELVDQELGGFKQAFAYRAEEAEKHGDFLLATRLRTAAADYCRLVAGPYHQGRAARSSGAQANLHRAAVAEYLRRAGVHSLLARGDRALAAIPGLQGPASRPNARLLVGHYAKAYKCFHLRVIGFKGGRWLTGKTPRGVAAILKAKGLKHPDESARFASVVILANLGEKDSLLAALADRSARVRLAAAEALGRIGWADGWAACGAHTDPAVRRAVAPLLRPAGENVLARARVVAELLRGLSSSSAGTKDFCRKTLERVAGRKESSADAWRAWWKKLGNARPGLKRSGPGSASAVDRTVDVGTWWQKALGNHPNPLAKGASPGKVRWSGRLVVAKAGAYRFYVRSRGGTKRALDGLGPAYFTSRSCAALQLDGKALLAKPSLVVRDTYPHMHIDCSEPVSLKPGLHRIVLELDVKSVSAADRNGPCARLYWSSDHFLRRVIPADNLIHLEGTAGG
jgi:hypothetical protein